MKWVSDNILAILALGASLVALWQSHRTARLSASLDRSNTLSEMYDKMRPGRKAMRTIWNGWATPDKKTNILTQSDREQFQSYYNADFHNAPSGSEQRELSNEIHILMHELDRVVDRIKDGEFTQDQVMRTFGHAIAMDQYLIRTYLDAHWLDHKEHQKPLASRFWSNVPRIVDDAEKWKSDSNKTT